MNIAETPYEQLSVGDKCISAVGRNGKIVQLPKIGEDIDFGDIRCKGRETGDHDLGRWIVIVWENKSRSVFYHQMGTNVQWLGQEQNND